MSNLEALKLAYIRDFLKTSTLEAAESASVEHLGKVEPAFCAGWMGAGVKQALKVLDEVLEGYE